MVFSAHAQSAAVQSVSDAAAGDGVMRVIGAVFACRAAGAGAGGGVSESRRTPTRHLAALRDQLLRISDGLKVRRPRRPTPTAASSARSSEAGPFHVGVAPGAEAGDGHGPWG